MAKSYGREQPPESIRALSRLRPRAVPISDAEYACRRERARRLMQEVGMAAMFMRGGASLAYFTGWHWANNERLSGMLLPAEGAPAFISPRFDQAYWLRRRTENHEIRGWREDECPYRCAATLLADRGLLSARIGIEEQVPYFMWRGLAQAAPAVDWLSADAVTAGCRAIKSSAEIALLAAASLATWQAYRAVWHAVEPGMEIGEVSGLVAAAYQALGVSGRATILSGSDSAEPRPSDRPPRLAEGTILMIDDGCTIEGYYGDITRTWVLGKPNDKMQRVFEVVRLAQQAALQAAVPGAVMGAVDAAARRLIGDAGYHPVHQFFPYRTGHGIGLEEHEWPYLSPGNKAQIQSGMTFTNEPGIYMEGQFGVRLEDDMYIDEAGAHFFTPPSLSLEQPFG